MNSRYPRIFAYHAIAHIPNDRNGAGTSPERFEAQMRYLKRRGLRGVSVRELRRAQMTDKDTRLVGLTFDDGYQDFLHTALPILERVGFSATVFAVAGMLGEENDWHHVYEPRPRLRLLTAEDLREISGRGMEVASHGLTHRKLSELAPEILEQEAADSRRILGGLLGETVEGFSYPYGSLTSAAVKAVQRAGYAYACAWNTYDRRIQVDLIDYLLPRIPVFQKDGLARFAVKLEVYPHYARLFKV